MLVRHCAIRKILGLWPTWTTRYVGPSSLRAVEFLTSELLITEYASDPFAR